MQRPDWRRSKETRRDRQLRLLFYSQQVSEFTLWVFSKNKHNECISFPYTNLPKLTTESLPVYLYQSDNTQPVICQSVKWQ